MFKKLILNPSKITKASNKQMIKEREMLPMTKTKKKKKNPLTFHTFY